MVKAARQRATDAELGVDLDLLLGRVFSRWKAHNGEALALYDQLSEVQHCFGAHSLHRDAVCAQPHIRQAASNWLGPALQAHPDDFRPALAKALVLKRCNKLAARVQWCTGCGHLRVLFQTFKPQCVALQPAVRAGKGTLRAML